MGSFKRNDSGYSGPGQASYYPDMTTTGVITAPPNARYFKIDRVPSTSLIGQLELDASSAALILVAGTNIEDVKYIYNPSVVSTLKLGFYW